MPKVSKSEQFKTRSNVMPPLRASFTPPSHEVDLGCRVRGWVNAKYAAEFKPALVPAPVEIEPLRVRIDLDGNAVLRAGCENLLDVDLASEPLLLLRSLLARRQRPLPGLPHRPVSWAREPPSMPQHAGDIEQNNNDNRNPE